MTEHRVPYDAFGTEPPQTCPTCGGLADIEWVDPSPSPNTGRMYVPKLEPIYRPLADPERIRAMEELLRLIQREINAVYSYGPKEAISVGANVALPWRDAIAALLGPKEDT